MLKLQTGKRVCGLSLLVVFTATLWGCNKQSPTFSQVNPPADKAVLYIFRNDALDESAPTFYIHVDGERIAGLRPNKYLYHLVEPGTHIVSCYSERESSVEIDARAGASYYIEAEITPGMRIGRPNLKVVNSEQALSRIGDKEHFQGKPLPKEQHRMMLTGAEGNY